METFLAFAAGEQTFDLGSVNETHQPRCWKNSARQHGDFEERWMATHFPSEATEPGKLSVLRT